MRHKWWRHIFREPRLCNPDSGSRTRNLQEQPRTTGFQDKCGSPGQA